MMDQLRMMEEDLHTLPYNPMKPHITSCTPLQSLNYPYNKD